MITRVEIDGFKTFRNFTLDLAPLQVIVGPNGAGKSNLFDALQLLAQLAGEVDLRTAFQQLRGEAGELFTIKADGQRADRLCLAVEMLVAPTVQDSWGAQAALRYTRLRYELAISRRTDEQGLERLYVEHEALAPIPRRSPSKHGRTSARLHTVSAKTVTGTDRGLERTGASSRRSRPR